MARVILLKSIALFAGWLRPTSGAAAVSQAAEAPGELSQRETAVQRTQPTGLRSEALSAASEAASVADRSPPRRRGQTPGNRRPGSAKGLNENYARELLELHTLGVDGGYTQNDVVEVARAFTGWTIDLRTGEFVFRADLHDTDSIVVLGQEIVGEGLMSDGEQVLDLLARHPFTARSSQRSWRGASSAGASTAEGFTECGRD